MRILHSSDWHLGKIFHEYSLIEDQRHILNQILKILKDAEDEGRPFTALLVSGDIYDRAVPPAEAAELLSSFLTEASESFPFLHIFMVSGNHDSASRLSFASSFLEKHNIHLATDTKNFLNPVVLEKNGEKAAFYQLPFLHPGSIASSDDNENAEKSSEKTDEKILRRQEELFREAAGQIIKNHKKKYGDIPAVLNAHLFTLGSAHGSSERSCIGEAERVDASVFKDFTYGAFGHIHKFQPCGNEHRCYYSGSLLPYNFDDSPDCGALDVEIKGALEIPSVKRILFSPLHKIATLEGKFSDFVSPQKNADLAKEHQNDFLQIILTGSDESHEPFARLKKIFPGLLLLSQKSPGSKGGNLSIKKRADAIKSNDFSMIFSQFLSDVYGKNYDENPESVEITEKEKALFKNEAQGLESQKSQS